MNKSITKEQEKILRKMGFVGHESFLELYIIDVTKNNNIIEALKLTKFDGWDVKNQEDIKNLIKDVLELGFELGEASFKNKLKELL